MKIFSFIVVLLVVGSLSLGAQPKMDSLLTVQKAQIEAIGTDLRELQGEIKEHRIREGFYSDVLGAHGTWCGILIALLGAGIGFVSWSKVKNAKDEVKKEFDAIMKEHKEADEKFREAVTRDRFNLMIMADNLYIQIGGDYIKEGNITYGLFFYMRSLTNSPHTKEFHLSLNEKSREIHKERTNKKIIIELLREILQSIDKIEKLNCEFLKPVWTDFIELEFYFDEGEEITALRKQIVDKLQPLFDEAEEPKNPSEQKEA